MAGVPPEKTFTREQLRRKIRLRRLLVRVLSPKAAGAIRHPHGTPMLLDTNAGQVRVLAYGFDDPRILPLFVNIHGGGFVLGRAQSEDAFMPRVVRDADVKILNVDYSLAPEAMFPVALEECYAVLKYAKEHATELGIDPDRMAVGGHSAGGNLSAAVCLLDAERKQLGLKAATLVYPPMDIHTDPYRKPKLKRALPPGMCRLFDQAYVGDREGARNPLISPCFADAGNLGSFPPTLVITAGQDSLAPEAETFKDRLAQAGVEVTFKRFEGARHGFDVSGDPGADESWRMLVDHLRRYLTPTTPSDAI